MFFDSPIHDFAPYIGCLLLLGAATIFWRHRKLEELGACRWLAWGCCLAGLVGMWSQYPIGLDYLIDEFEIGLLVAVLACWMAAVAMLGFGVWLMGRSR